MGRQRKHDRDAYAGSARVAGTPLLIGALLVLLQIPVANGDELADGVAAFRRKDYATAYSLLEPLAQSGSSQAQLRLGQMFYHGQGVNEDDSAAFQWFSRAAAQGNAESQVQLANLYLYGQGVPAEDHDHAMKAAQWYFAAARQGHPEAQYNLGLLFATGKGVERSEKEARKWMQRAAAQGHGEAKAFLATQAKSR